jgi:hypothetical protein
LCYVTRKLSVSLCVFVHSFTSFYVLLRKYVCHFINSYGSLAKTIFRSYNDGLCHARNNFIHSYINFFASIYFSKPRSYKDRCFCSSLIIEMVFGFFAVLYSFTNNFQQTLLLVDIYFSAVTSSTIGYSDFIPLTLLENFSKCNL